MISLILRDPRHILLTGLPGIGKTTVIVRLAEQLREHKVAGVFTEEIRSDGKRQGFCVATFSGKSEVFAHTAIKSQYRVGRYGVDLAAFERVALPELARPSELVLIDEIGKMECFSARFVDAVRRCLEGPGPVVATVAASGPGFIRDVKRRSDVEIWEVDQENRDHLPEELATRLVAI